MGNNYSELPNVDENDVILAQTERDIFSPRVLTARRKPIVRPAVHLDTINWLCPVRPEMVVSCSSDKTVCLNNMDTGACLMRWRGHEREVNKVVYKHVGCRHCLLSASKDCSQLFVFVQICDQFLLKQLFVFGILICRNVARCSPGIEWASAVWRLPMIVLAFFKAKRFLHIFADGKFVSGGRDGKMCLWDMEIGESVRNVGSSQNLVTHIEANAQAKVLYQTAEDGILRVWDAQNLTLIDQLPSNSNHPQWHCSVCPTDENAFLTSGGGNAMNDGCEIGLWDIRQRQMVQQFRGHDANVRSAIFLHQQQVTWKRLVLSVSADHSTRLWDINTGRCVWTESIAAELNSCIGFSDGSVVIGGGHATLCELRLLIKTGRPLLYCNSIQSTTEVKEGAQQRNK